MGFSLLVMSRGYSPVAGHRFLIEVAFLAAGHGFLFEVASLAAGHGF